MKRLNQQGVGHLVVILAVVVITAIGLIGWKVMSANSDKPTTTASSSPQAAVPSTIKNKADLTQASNALDSTNVDSVNPDSLNNDLNSL